MIKHGYVIALSVQVVPVVESAARLAHNSATATVTATAQLRQPGQQVRPKPEHGQLCMAHVMQPSDLRFSCEPLYGPL